MENFKSGGTVVTVKFTRAVWNAMVAKAGAGLTADEDILALIVHEYHATRGFYTIIGGVRVLVGENDRLVVSGGAITSVIPAATVAASYTALVTVITVIEPPGDLTVEAGSAAVFDVDAQIQPSGTITYQWEESIDGGTTWAAMSGKTAAVLTIAVAALGTDGYMYRCVLSATDAETVTTARATLTMLVPVITIIEQPANLAVAPNAAAAFDVDAQIQPSGTITYQWEQSIDSGTTWTVMAAEVAADLAIASAAIGTNGYMYRCTLSAINAVPVTSTPVTLTVA